MKPENILQADLLDLIFLNRNKEYGAYALRKHYDSRLLKSFAFTFLLALSFSIGQYLKSNFFKDEKAAFDAPLVHDVEFIKPAEPEKQKEIKKEIQKSPKQLAEKIYVVPKIVKDELADKDVPEVKELDNKMISNIDKEGEDAVADEVSIPAETFGDEAKGVVAPIEPVEVEVPLIKAEVMPEFPGGMEAFKKFMLKNLRQPDLNEGEKVVVRVQFVVDKEGAINNVVVLQSGGRLDGEVIRVVNKMPKWKPGLQNGKLVPVYFSLPVTFMGPEI